MTASIVNQGDIVKYRDGVRRKSDNRSVKFKMFISEINVYPVKSLGGIALETSVVEDRGLQDDRRFMIVDENNDFITQREFSNMSTVDCDLRDDEIIFSAKGFGELRLPKEFEASKTVRVRVWQSFCDAIEAEPAINDWFSELMGVKCKLVKMPRSTQRQINEAFNRGNEIVSFADGYPLLVIGERSLSDLNSKLEKRIPMNRFRPNIVVSGSDSFAEDLWEKIKIGETIFRVTKPCARCVITTIDQATGISDIKEPSKTLAEFRKASQIYPATFTELGLSKNNIVFGQNLVAENFGQEIKLGDKIEIV